MCATSLCITSHVLIYPKFLEQFIFEIARDETDQEKRRKLKALVLSDEEWKRVELLMKLLRVRSYHFRDMEKFFINNRGPFSTQTMPNKHFHTIAGHAFTQVSLPSKPCTPHGRIARKIQNLICFRMAWMRQWRRSQSITTRQLLRMHIPS